MVALVTDDSFDKEVLKSDKPVLVDFFADWCGPCRALAPVIDELANSVSLDVKIVKMNIDSNPNVPTSLEIRSIPTLILFNKGIKIAVKVGMQSKDSLIEWINSKIE